MPMIKRQCAECGGELVLAVNSMQPESNNGPTRKRASTHWRCTTCGGTFTAAQLRDHERDHLKFHEST